MKGVPNPPLSSPQVTVSVVTGKVQFEISVLLILARDTWRFLRKIEIYRFDGRGYDSSTSFKFKFLLLSTSYPSQALSSR